MGGERSDRRCVPCRCPSARQLDTHNGTQLYPRQTPAQAQVSSVSGFGREPCARRAARRAAEIGRRWRRALGTRGAVKFFPVPLISACIPIRQRLDCDLLHLDARTFPQPEASRTEGTDSRRPWNGDRTRLPAPGNTFRGSSFQSHSDPAPPIGQNRYGLDRCPAAVVPSHPVSDSAAIRKLT